MRLFRVVRGFCTANPSLINFYDIVRPVSLSSNELKRLQSLEPYQHMVRAFNLNRLPDCLNYVTRTSQMLSDSDPTEINLAGYLLNTEALVFKMMEQTEAMSLSLQKLFLLHSSYFGNDHPSSIKHFQNYFLSLLYGKTQKAKILLQYVQELGLPQGYHNLIRLLSSILYSTTKGSERIALKELEGFVPASKEQEVMMINNKAWLEIWAKAKPTPGDFLAGAQQITKAVRVAEIEDTPGYLKERSQSEELLMKFFVQKGGPNTTSKSVQSLKFINKNSHILCMNVGEALVLSGKEQDAAVWLQLSSRTAVNFHQFTRVARALIYTARLFQSNGMPQQSQSLYLSVLKHCSMIPVHNLKFLLGNYCLQLQKESRYYQAEHLLSQMMTLEDLSKEDRLDRLLVPEYDFTY